MSQPSRPQIVPQPYAQPSKTPTHPELKAVKSRGNLKLILGCITAILGTGSGGYFANKGGEKVVQSDIAVIQQQLKDHIEVSNSRNDELKDTQKKLNRRTRKIETNLLINKAQNDLVLDKLGVPKSKRPTEDDVAVIEEEGE